MERLQWNEPRGYRRARYHENDRRNSWSSIGYAFFVFVILLLLRLLAGVHPSPGAHLPAWPTVMGVALGFALFVAFVLPRIAGLITLHIVILSDIGINLNSIGFSKIIRFTRWDEISSCELKKESVGGKEYSVIYLYGGDRAFIHTLALDDRMCWEEVKSILVAHNVKIE